MKAEEIRALSNEEIKEKISQTKKELFELRLQSSTGKLEKPSEITKKKKTIARMLTILRERELNDGGQK